MKINIQKVLSSFLVFIIEFETKKGWSHLVFIQLFSPAKVFIQTPSLSLHRAWREFCPTGYELSFELTCLFPMLHGHDNVEIDTTRWHAASSYKYTRHVCPTRFSDTFRTRHYSMIEVFVLHSLFLKLYVETKTFQDTKRAYSLISLNMSCSLSTTY